ncbi:NuoN1: NADH quinone oxidoreductase, subunit N [Desulfosarcina variabilis str. Montpellier]|uniref:NADH-quinone oxidoreductase subunit N n=1 Tax=Desulfosarcina variabilis TaxID=2300 RepID=UPI003AFA6D15
MDIRPELILSEGYQLLLVALLFIQSLDQRLQKPAVRCWLPTMAGLGVCLALYNLNASGVIFSGTYCVDKLSQFFKVLISMGFALAVLNASRQPTLDREKRADYFLLMGLSVLGLMILASAAEMITIYLALELSSYSLYALVALRGRECRAAEAAIKYIFFGAAATALALYGFSYILATQHTSYLVQLAEKTWSWSETPLAIVGMTLFMGGMFYKLALFPLHFWAPDVYQGASNETATFIATLPKLGALVVLMRLVAVIPGPQVTLVIAILAAASMTYGNLSALAQTDVKRLLGYSAIAHAGYLMVGLVAGTNQGLDAAAFYILVYVLMNFACFWVICRVGADGRNLKLTDLNGLHHRSPALAFVLAVGAFSLVGLPPTAGFMGKFFLLTSAWDHGYNWLVVVAAVNTAISIYYYLNLVRHAYTHDEPERLGALQREPLFSNVWGLMLAGLVLLLGVLPGPVFDAAVAAGSNLIR